MTSNTNQQKVNDIVKGLLDAPEKTAFIAIKGKQGKHDVFTLMMPLSVLAELFEADVGAAFERSQRPVNKKRALGVTNYIRENCSNYVLPSLTASIEDFTPSPALNFGSIYNDDDFKTDTCKLDVDGFDSANVVALNVPKTSRWWFIDGQHRATGIQGLKTYLRGVGMEISDMLPSNTVPVMVRLDSGLEDRQNQFSVINSNMVKPNANLNSLYQRKERAGRAISGSIDRYFRISDIEFDKSSCSGKSPKRFAYKHLIDASLTMLNCKMDDDASEKDIKRLRGMWALFTSLSVWSDNDLKTSQQLRESTIVPHAVFISAFALASKRIREDGVEFESLVEVFDKALDYSREADCWEGLCIIDGKLTKNSKTVSATAEYIYSQISDSKEYQKLLGGKA